MEIIVIGICCMLVGIGITFFSIKFRNSRKAFTIIEEANKEADQIKKEKLLQAKEKFIELKSEHEKIISKKNNDINNAQQRIKQKENTLNQKTADFNRKLAFELIECFSKFSGSLFSYCSILMSREMNKGTTIDDKVTELGIEMLSNEVHLVKAKAIAGVLGRPELVSKFLTFESVATKTINTLLSSSEDKLLALKKLRNQEAELIKALNRLSEL